MTTKTKRPRFTWTTEALAMLGTVPDREVAQKYRILRTSVVNKRVALGISPFQHQQRPDETHTWTACQIALLGKKADSEVAIQLGLGNTAVRNKRIALGIAVFNKWSTRADILAMLGVLADTEINEQHGVPISTLLRMRKARNIAAVGKAGKPTVPLPAEAQALLGKVNDVELAKRFSIPVKRVSKARHRLAETVAA